MRKTIQDLNAMKAKRDKIIALTAYDYQTAEILDEICDLILVGDSLGNVFQGKEYMLLDHHYCIHMEYPIPKSQICVFLEQ